MLDMTATPAETALVAGPVRWNQHGEPPGIALDQANRRLQDHAALFADALALFDHVAPRHAALDLIGRSLGSAVAVYLASQRGVDRVALVTPYDSVLAVARAVYPLYPVDWLLKDGLRDKDWEVRVGVVEALAEVTHTDVVDALVKALDVFQGAYRQLSGLGRTVRGPVMSCTPGYSARATLTLRHARMRPGTPSAESGLKASGSRNRSSIRR